MLLQINDVLQKDSRSSKITLVKVTEKTAIGDNGMKFEREYKYEHCIKTKKQWRNKVIYPSFDFKLVK